LRMDNRLQAYLDGELTLEDLPLELRARAREWNALIDDIRDASPAGAPLGLDTRILAALDSAGRRARPAWITWLLRPRLVPVPPAAALAVLAGLFLIVTVLGVPGGDAIPESRVYVQFVVEAPSAETVQLVGDFTEWQPTVELEDADGDGVWSGRVPLLPGVHEYMFVIDGSDWVTDPNAAGYQDDGFGQKNSIVAVSPVSGT